MLNLVLSALQLLIVFNSELQDTLLQTIWIINIRFTNVNVQVFTTLNIIATILKHILKTYSSFTKLFTYIVDLFLWVWEHECILFGLEILRCNVLHFTEGRRLKNNRHIIIAFPANWKSNDNVDDICNISNILYWFHIHRCLHLKGHNWVRWIITIMCVTFCAKGFFDLNFNYSNWKSINFSWNCPKFEKPTKIKFFWKKKIYTNCFYPLNSMAKTWKKSTLSFFSFLILNSLNS